jgi:2,3-bisphosphoglycerate-dependent phosphoglycerate mutase
MSTPAAWMVLFRHGHSEWNLSDRFTGWTDIPLTEVGLAEAAAAGRQLAHAGYAFDEVHGSALQRTRQTVEALLAAMGTPEVPLFTTWRLNERHYGALQGMNKQEIFATWGEAASRRWWRGYYEPPPPLDMTTRATRISIRCTRRWRPRTCPPAKACATASGARCRTGTRCWCRACVRGAVCWW